MSETKVNLAVSGIAFTPLPQPLFTERKPVNEAMSLLTETLGRQVNQLVEKTGISPEHFERHFLCSTMIELPFTTQSVKWQDLVNQLKEHGSHQPDTFINAYECASWGYSLRHYLKQDSLAQKQTKYMIVSIIDANVYDFEFWRYNDHWEHSGFGITTVILEVQAPLTDELTIGSAKTHNGVAEFATVVRRTMQKKPGATVALPFFPVNVQNMFEKLLRGQPSLPDLHADHGHCFGSDPWLSLLTHALVNKIEVPQRFMACSVALNGYYAIAELMMTPDTVLIINKEWQHEQGVGSGGMTKPAHTSNPNQSFQGSLEKMPFGNRPSKAGAQMLPLSKASDFEVFADFTSTDQPVLLSIPEHYEILSELAGLANEHLPNITMLVRISMPGGMRIPANLLADNVLLAEDLEAEEHKLVASLTLNQDINNSANPLLVIEDRFTRMEIDNNDNSIKLRLYGKGDLQPLVSHLSDRSVVAQDPVQGLDA